MQKVQQGTKISGKKASAAAYIPYYEFLLYDPLYKGMSDKAKTLYSFLRNKLKTFKAKQELYEAGELSQSFADEEGNIFILADNTELAFILNASEPTVIKTKKELKTYGLLLEERIKDHANRIYILEPAAISERWKWIEDVKKLRDEKEKENKEKAKRQKEKKEKKEAETRAAAGNLKNLSYGNLKNLSYVTKKILVKDNLKGFKSKSKSIKNKLNQSIIESEILLNWISKNLDRLTDSKIKAINDLFELQLVDEKIFTSKLAEVMDHNPGNFKGYLKKTLENEIKKSPAGEPQQPIRKEMLPDWYEKQKQQEAEGKTDEQPSADFEEERRKLEEELKQYRNAR